MKVFSYILCIKNLFFHHLNSWIDVAIGAPQEDDLRGAIYIYNGRADGISSAFSQVGDNFQKKHWQKEKEEKLEIFWETSNTAQKNTRYILCKGDDEGIFSIYYKNMLALP